METRREILSTEWNLNGMYCMNRSGFFRLLQPATGDVRDDDPIGWPRNDVESERAERASKPPASPFFAKNANGIFIFKWSLLQDELMLLHQQLRFCEDCPRYLRIRMNFTAGRSNLIYCQLIYSRRSRWRLLRQPRFLQNLPSSSNNTAPWLCCRSILDHRR